SLDEQKPRNKARVADKTAPAAPAAKKENNEVQGVFVVKNNKAEFRKVETGLTGTTEIEIKSGLKADEVIITGSYKVLKTIRNGAGVKVDNSLANKPGES